MLTSFSVWNTRLVRIFTNEDDWDTEFKYFDTINGKYDFIPLDDAEKVDDYVAELEFAERVDDVGDDDELMGCTTLN